jgi:glycosyltransferase involved in cell wall biosynthesis
MKKLPSLSVFYPSLNDSKILPYLIYRTYQVLPKITKDFEVIVINDGSTDDTSQLLKSLGEREPMLRTVRHQRTRGYGAAVRSGCDAATQEIIAFMDSDGQFDPQDIHLLLQALATNDIAWGVRARRADGMLRSVTQWIYQALVRATIGLRSPDLNSGMKAFHRRTWTTIRPTTADGALFHAELLQRALAARVSIAHVAVRHFPRTCGTPTGIQLGVIARMFRELRSMRRLPTAEHGKP